MKKKTIIAVLVVLIVLLIAALLMMQSRNRTQNQAPAASQSAQNAQNAQPAAPQAEATPAVLAEEELTVNVSAQEAADEMLPVIDAEIRAMYSAGTGYFDIENAALCWNALAVLCSSEDLPEGMVEKLDDGTVKVGAENMRRLAQACFASRAELPELPEDNKTVSYDKDADAYIIKKAEADTLSCEIMETMPTGEGAYSASVALLDSSADIPLISTYSFDVLPFAAGENSVQPAFSKCVYGGYDACNMLAQVTALEEANGEYTLEVHPIQLHWETEGEGEEEEAYIPVIVADAKPDQKLRLHSVEMVDWNTVGIVIGGEEQNFGSAEKAWEWFEENYSKKIEDEGVVYQMRVYKDTVYSMAPLYSFYFAG